MVTSLAGAGAALGEVSRAASGDATRYDIETLLASVGKAEQEQPEQAGAVGLFCGLRDPDVQYRLGYLLGLAGAMGREWTNDEFQ